MSALSVFARNGRCVALALSMALGLAHFACGSDQRLPPAAPALETPSDAVPPELDFVLRVDVGRLRSALGSAAIAKLRDRFNAEDGFERFSLHALERTDVFVLAIRLERGKPQDAVIAIEGDYRGLDPRKYPTDPPWQKPIDLGGDVRRYDRKKPKGRVDPARLYVRSDRVMVFASEATLDSVEAVIEKHRPGNSVRPPDRGLLSAAMRLRPGSNPFARDVRFPKQLAGVRYIEGFIDQTATGFQLHLVCELDGEGEATNAAAVVEVARAEVAKQTTRTGAFMRHATVESQGKHLVVRVDMPMEVFGEMLGDVLR